MSKSRKKENLDKINILIILSYFNLSYFWLS
jgi:hypothetical protein